MGNAILKKSQTILMIGAALTGFAVGGCGDDGSDAPPGVDPPQDEEATGEETVSESEYPESGGLLVLGSRFDDLIEGSERADLLFGFAGDDYIDGRAGDDYVSGGQGADRLTGDEGDDQLRGNSGDDTIDGSNGDDALDGGAQI